jgi:predicted Zn-ribbon and HTH transcriptional regulator
MTMDENTIEALADFLSTGVKASEPDTPSEIVGTEFVQKTVRPPSRCPGGDCGARVYDSFEVFEGDIAYEVVCKRGCEHEVTRTEATTYRFQPLPTLAAIASHLNLDPGDEDWVNEQLPRYAGGTTDDGVDLCLIVDPHKYADTIRDILFDAVERQRPMILLTPRESADEIIAIAESYPLGSLVTPLPLELLTEREAVTNLLETSRSALEMEELLFEKRGLAGDELAEKLSRRPRLIEAQLNYIRILREDSTRRYKLGEQMETVCKAAFMALDCRLLPEFGGTESRGTSIPDIVFQMAWRSDEERERELPRVLAIVDAKSGTDADFENEDIIGKHRGYIRAAKGEPAYSDHDLTHLFVVFDIDDYNEIDWYEGIKSTYRKHTGMVVLYGDALLLMVRAAQSPPMRNQINLSEGEFEEFIRPFFQRRLYTDEEAYPTVATMTRFDQVEELTKRQQEYRRDYHRQPGLLIVTPEMVRQRFEAVVGEDGLEPILSAYTD